MVALKKIRVVFGLAFSSSAIADLYSIGRPTNDEQFMLELVNRARANGNTEAIQLGISNVNEGPPTLGPDSWTIMTTVEPLSSNPKWQRAAMRPVTRPERHAETRAQYTFKIAHESRLLSLNVKELRAMLQPRIGPRTRRDDSMGMSWRSARHAQSAAGWDGRSCAVC